MTLTTVATGTGTMNDPFELRGIVTFGFFVSEIVRALRQGKSTEPAYFSIEGKLFGIKVENGPALNYAEIIKVFNLSKGLLLAVKPNNGGKSSTTICGVIVITALEPLATPV